MAEGEVFLCATTAFPPSDISRNAEPRPHQSEDAYDEVDREDNDNRPQLLPGPPGANLLFDHRAAKSPATSLMTRRASGPRRNPLGNIEIRSKSVIQITG